MQFSSMFGALLLIGALAAIGAELRGQAQVLLDESFEDLAVWLPGVDMNSQPTAAWTTTVVSPPGEVDPTWHHQAHAAGNPGPTGNPAPKAHMVQRLGNANLGGGNFFGANLHWRGLTLDVDNSYVLNPGDPPYVVELGSPAFPSFPIPGPGPIQDDFLLTIKFDLAIDLLRENVPHFAGGVFMHNVDVIIRDIPSMTDTLIMPIGQPTTSERRDMTRYVFETRAVPFSSNNDSGDWQLIFAARSDASMPQHLYDYWIDNVQVLLNYHQDFSPQPPKDPYEVSDDPILHPAGGPFHAIGNNNTMAHPHFLGLYSFGSVATFPGAWAVGVDNDFYSIHTDPGVPIMVEIADQSADGIEAELFRVERFEIDAAPAAREKYMWTKSVAWTNTGFSGGPGATLTLTAQHFAPSIYILRVTSISGAMAPYDVTVTDILGMSGRDFYGEDGEGPFGAPNNDTRNSATGVATGYNMTHLLHGADEDWYSVVVSAGDQILVSLVDMSTGSTDGIQVSLIRVVSGQETHYVDIDETGLGAWAGNQAEVAHVAPNDSVYLIRVWRYWQTQTLAGPPSPPFVPPWPEYRYDITVNVNSPGSYIARTIHAPVPPAIAVTPPVAGVYGLTGSTPGHEDHVVTWSHFGPFPIAPTPPPSGTVTPAIVVLPTGSLWYTSIFWDTTGASPGIHATVLFFREHLYGRVPNADDLVVSAVVIWP